VLRERGVVPRASLSEEENHNFIPDDLSNYRVVRQGDLVINKMKAWQGSVGIAPMDGIVSPAYFVFELEGASSEFYHRVLRSRMYVDFFASSSDGVRIGQWDLNINRMKRIPIFIPPPSEQAAIVRFLDSQDRQITRLIRAKRRLIDLLTEQKQAIIQQAVTRGPDPNVRLKDSGVPWLGEVPEHWEVKRLKWVTRLQRGYDLPQDQREPGNVPVVSSGGVIDTHSEARAQGPSVVMGRYGSTDAVFFLEEDFWPHNTALFVTDFYGNDPRWCFYLLSSISKADYATKSAVPGVDRKDLYEIYVARPPVAEQAALVVRLEAQLATLESSLLAVKKEIDLLREYRTRLISDVVTGKLDVRGLELPVMDEPMPLYELEADAEMDDEEMLAAAEEEAVYAVD
jgi:type I restriction enzyme S subunit